MLCRMSTCFAKNVGLLWCLAIWAAQGSAQDVETCAANTGGCNASFPQDAGESGVPIPTRKDDWLAAAKSVEKLGTLHVATADSLRRAQSLVQGPLTKKAIADAFAALQNAVKAALPVGPEIRQCCRMFNFQYRYYLKDVDTSNACRGAQDEEWPETWLDIILDEGVTPSNAERLTDALSRAHAQEPHDKPAMLRLAVAFSHKGKAKEAFEMLKPAAAAAISSEPDALKDDPASIAEVVETWVYLGATSGAIQGAQATEALTVAGELDFRGNAAVYSASLQGDVPFETAEKLFKLKQHLRISPSDCASRLELAVRLRAVKTTSGAVLQSANQAGTALLEALPIECPALIDHMSRTPAMWRLEPDPKTGRAGLSGDIDALKLLVRKSAALGLTPSNVHNSSYPSLEEMHQRASPWKHISVRQVAESPAVFHLAGLLDADEVEKLSKIFKEGLRLRPEKRSSTVTTVTMDKMPTLRDSAILKQLDARLAAICGLPESHVEYGYFTIYGQGHKFDSLHLDNHHINFDPVRVVSFVIFISGEDDGLVGGQTVFPLAVVNNSVSQESQEEREQIEVWDATIRSSHQGLGPGGHPQLGRTCSPPPKKEGKRKVSRSNVCGPALVKASKACSRDTELAVNGKNGDAVMFYNYAEGGDITARAIHASCGVKQGTKIVLAKFVGQDPTLTPEGVLLHEERFSRLLDAAQLPNEIVV